MAFDSSRVSIWRSERGLSQAEAAKKVGVSQCYFSEIESGKKTPSFDVIEAIAMAMGRTVGELSTLGQPLVTGGSSPDLKTLQSRLCDLIGAIEKLHSECDTPEEVMRLLLDVGDNGEINHPENRAFIDLLETLAPLAGEILRSIRRGERVAS